MPGGRLHGNQQLFDVQFLSEKVCRQKTCKATAVAAAAMAAARERSRGLISLLKALSVHIKP